MSSVIKLTIASCFPVLATFMFGMIDKKNTSERWSGKFRQVAIGIFFGLIAITGTEWGIPMHGAMVNCRDAAPLCAGLFFGGPAGIIAGCIGGIERWIAVAWGVGTYTRVACSVSTIIAGFYAYAVRKYLLDNKRPSWNLAFAIGIAMEVFHLIMVFVTNINDAAHAAEVLKAVSTPQLVANSLSVLAATIVITIVSGEQLSTDGKKISISYAIQKGLLVTVTLAFLLTTFFIYILQTGILMSQADDLLDLGITDVTQELESGRHDSGSLKERASSIVENRRIGSTGFLIIFDKERTPVALPSGYDISKLAYTSAADENKIGEHKIYQGTAFDIPCYFMYCTTDQFYILGCLPKEEAMGPRDTSVMVNTFLEVLVFAALFGLVYFLIKSVVVDNIKRINYSLDRISKGDLDTTINVRSSEEFSSLSDDINTTVGTLKGYIAAAAARIDEELEFARNIQESSLPRIFPAFPGRKDFDIYALMDAAKEVGGDFYDFYFTGRNRLNILVADVSGKGIPGAMFMMRAKTELKSLTDSRIPIEEVFTKGNSGLCEGNDAGMFVTAWQGCVNLENGHLEYVNAGHNPPLIKHAGGEFEFLRSRAGLVLAGMDGIKYKKSELDLEKGDILFLYTDGVTEATNAHNELYGEERLQNCLNSIQYSDMQELCTLVKKDVDRFVGEAPQFDDITMEAFIYNGKDTSITFEQAVIPDITTLTEFVEGELEKLDCPMKAQVQIDVALDEIFSNIVNYAYKDGPGRVTVSVAPTTSRPGVRITFTDQGKPYNPIKNEDPDITLSASDRPIGGLGIYMVKKTMDDMEYSYKGESNILMIKKYF